MYPISSLFKSDIESKALRIVIIAQSTYFLASFGLFCSHETLLRSFPWAPKEKLCPIFECSFYEALQFFSEETFHSIDFDVRDQYYKISLGSGGGEVVSVVAFYSTIRVRIPLKPIFFQ